MGQGKLMHQIGQQERFSQAVPFRVSDDPLSSYSGASWGLISVSTIGRCGVVGVSCFIRRVTSPKDVTGILMINDSEKPISSSTPLNQSRHCALVHQGSGATDVGQRESVV